MLDDTFTKCYLVATLVVFIMFVIGNHATKCTDVLMYDVTLISIIVLYVITWAILYDRL